MRRMFMMVSLIALAAPTLAEAKLKVSEQSVVVKTPDGNAEAAVFTPTGKGTWPAVILWPDMVGLRPLYRDLGRKYAEQGFVVLVPSSFYRSMRPSDAEIDPWDPKIRPTLMQYRAAATDDGIARDATAYFAYLDTLKQTARAKKAGTIGYDLGGSYAFRTAAALPGRVAAVASLYGLGVATPRPDSPHLLVPKSRATYYVLVTADDDKREPEDKGDITKQINDAGLKGGVEVSPANHGFANPAGKTYDAAATEKSFAAVVKLLKAELK